MAKRSSLSTGKENSKRFDFMLNDDDFEEHTRGFVLATTAADTQKCIKVLLGLSVGIICAGVG